MRCRWLRRQARCHRRPGHLDGRLRGGAGNGYAGIMGNSQDWIDTVTKAAKQAGERLWQLPLPDDYRQQLDSSVADMANIGSGNGGTITAGLFLSEFVSDGIDWAHLDIARHRLFRQGSRRERQGRHRLRVCAPWWSWPRGSSQPAKNSRKRTQFQPRLLELTQYSPNPDNNRALKIYHTQPARQPTTQTNQDQTRQGETHHARSRHPSTGLHCPRPGRQ